MTTTWNTRAACQGLDPQIFFPAVDEDAEPAKQVCSLCVVQHECLEHTLGVKEKEGVWGGLTERERRSVLRRRRRAAS